MGVSLQVIQFGPLDGHRFEAFPVAEFIPPISEISTPMIYSDLPQFDLPLDQTVQLVLFGNHRLLLDSLSCRLESETDIRVLLAQTDWRQGLRVCLESSPDIALIDLDLKESDPFEIVAEISAKQRVTRFIFLAQQFSDISIEKALEVQASGLLLKRESMTVLISAIRRICRGHFCFSGEVEQRVTYNDLNHSYTTSPGTGLASLTDRQKEVLTYLALGLSVKEVSRRMYLSPKSVDSHKYRLMSKLGIHDRVKLARYAIREGIVEA
jgi:DNA-binding NarL/FixJ family response regulator